MTESKPSIPAKTTPSTHTPGLGPLTQEDGPQYIHTPGDRFIAVLKDGPNQAAYGRLFCAAPDLLEALRGVLSMLELLNRPGTNDPIEARVFQARAAIAKATQL